MKYKIMATTKRVETNIICVVLEINGKLAGANTIPWAASDIIAAVSKKGFLDIRAIRIAQKSLFLNRCNILRNLHCLVGSLFESIHHEI